MNNARVIEILTNNNIDAETVTVFKNGVNKVGVTVGSGRVRPTLYSDAFENMESEEELLDLVNRIIDSSPEVGAEVTSPEYIKENINTKLVRKAGDGVVFRKFLDLEEILIVGVGLGSGKGSYKITEKIVEQYNLDVDELFAIARNRNTHIYLSMEAAIMGVDTPVSKDDPMTIITNTEKVNGATAMTDVEFLKELARVIDRDEFYIIPSSIHECIVVNGNNINVRELYEMVSSTNDTEVSPEERLSYNVYFFNGEEVVTAKI